MRIKLKLPRLAALRLWTRTHRGRAVAISAAASLAIIAISCGTLTNTVMAPPPQIPGAKFVGSQSCEQCHEDITKHFKTSDHAMLIAKGGNADEMGCESCHGPGSLHNESGGAPHTIVNPLRDPETCFQCHLDKRAEFSLPHSHPLEAGRVTCADCHNPHEGSALKGGGTLLASSDEVCFKCHKEQRGPFVFPHEVMREGCTSCHNPHGSVNEKMLISRNADLCLKCHFQQQFNTTQLAIGDVSGHASFLSRGTCWSAGCHEAVHGSQVSGHLRF